MNATYLRRTLLAAICAGLAALTLTSSSAAHVGIGSARPSTGPIVTIDSGAVRGVAVSGRYVFLGLPYAAPPTGGLRWQAPRPRASWKGVRDATQYAASCPQPPSGFAGPGPFSEDCLYLNVFTPSLRRNAERPVLVWIHGGGFTQDASRNYDGSKLAGSGIVVVTISYRLGALGFLAHPALASQPGGPAGNYGLMDQQAALRWVRHNIAAIRRRSGERDDCGPVGRRRGGARPPGLARLARALPSGDRAERRVRADAAVSRRRRGCRGGVRRQSRGGLPGPDRAVPAGRAGRGPRRQLPWRGDPGRR